MPGDPGPALVIDATVAEHLEVLQVVHLGRIGIVEGIGHAEALQRRLLDAIDEVGAGRPATSSTVGATSMTWRNCDRISSLALIPLGQCTIVPLRVPPQWEATCLVH